MMLTILIILGIYWLLVLTGWAMVLYFANEKWWAALVPVWGLYKRVKALEKLSIKGKLLELKHFDSSDLIGENKPVFLAHLFILFLMYLYGEFLIHFKYFWKFAKLAGEDTPFAMGMVLCPPLFMWMLWKQNEKEAQAIRDKILKIDQEKEAEKLEEKRMMEGQPLWKCKGCGAQWPMDRDVCRECGTKRV